jgi:hypothetical protein
MTMKELCDQYVTRRHFAMTSARSSVSFGSAGPAEAGACVAANRILADQGIVDGYGYVSVQRFCLRKVRTMGDILHLCLDVLSFFLPSG